MRQTLQFLEFESLAFPSPSLALKEPNGLLAIGGDLSPKRLVEAYKKGIFPWYSDNEPIMWWSPNPRAIIDTNKVCINRTLRKVLNRKHFTVSINKAFADVITQCANAPFRNEETWITPSMRAAYIKLHNQGYAHSVEVWYERELVGGLYGIAINGYFSGESMFYKASNASKVALVTLAQLLAGQGIPFIDCQMQNPFLLSMGATEISREAFIHAKDKAIEVSLAHTFWQPRDLDLLY